MHIGLYDFFVLLCEMMVNVSNIIFHLYTLFIPFVLVCVYQNKEFHILVFIQHIKQVLMLGQFYKLLTSLFPLGRNLASSANQLPS